MLRAYRNLPATRAEALDLGCKYYFAAKVCEHGHVVPRYTSNGACVACEHPNPSTTVYEHIRRDPDLAHWHRMRKPRQQRDCRQSAATVYVVEVLDAGYEGRSKIGRTTRDPSKRFKEIQAHSPLRLGLKHVESCRDLQSAHNLEQEVLHRLADDVTHGEWIRVNPDELVALVRGLNTGSTDFEWGCLKNGSTTRWVKKNA